MHIRKKIIKCLIQASSILTIFLTLSNTAFCGETYSLSISCVIPEIPGVNAPLIEENARINASVNPDYQEEKTEQQGLAMIQQDAQVEKNIGNKDNSLLLVKTIYSR